MKSSLKNKFSDLNENGICSICKFDAEEEDLLWVHIGTLHERVNIVLSTNGSGLIEQYSSIQYSPHNRIFC